MILWGLEGSMVRACEERIRIAREVSLECANATRARI